MNPSANPPIAARLEFTYENDSIIPITADLSQLNTDIRYMQGLESYYFGSNNCQVNNDTVHCRSGRIGISPDTSEPSIQVTNIANIPSDLSYTIPLTIYEQDLEVNNIQINDCEEQTCFVSQSAQNELKINLEDSAAGYKRANIYYQIGNQGQLANSCENNICTGVPNINCADGESFNMKVVRGHGGIASRDDAGNRVSQYVSPTEIICDNTAPVIENVSFTNLDGRERMSILDTISMNIQLSDAYSNKYEISVYSRAFGSDPAIFTCDRTECTYELPSPEERGEYRVQINATDQAGNTASINREISILGVDEREPDFWEVERVELSSDPVNKDNLVFSRDVYGTATLRADSQVELYDIESAGNCLPDPTFSRGGEEGDIVDFNILSYDDENRVFFKFTLPSTSNEEGSRFQGVNRLKFKCPIDLYTTNQEFVFTLPQNENMTIDLSLQDGQNIGAEIRRQIEASDKRLERNQKILHKFDYVKNSVGGLCEINNRAKDTALIASAATTAMSAANVITGGALSEQDLDTQKGQKAIEASKETVQKVLDSTCAIWACDHSLPPFDSINEWYAELWDSTPVLGNDTVVGDALSQTFGMESMDQAVNPYSSPIIALTQGCVPAIAHHIEVYAGLNCAYNECLAHGTVNLGQTVSSCNKAYKDSRCMFTSEAISQAIPLTAFATDALQKMSNLLKDPVAAFGFGIAGVCGLSTGSNLLSVYMQPAPLAGAGYGACGKILHIQELQKTASAAENILSYGKGLFGENKDNQCERVRNLKDPVTHAWNLAEDPQYEQAGDYESQYGCQDGLCPTELRNIYVEVDNGSQYASAEDNEWEGIEENIKIYRRDDESGSYTYIDTMSGSNAGSSSNEDEREGRNKWDALREDFVNEEDDGNEENEELRGDIAVRGLRSYSEEDLALGVFRYVQGIEETRQNFINSYPDEESGKAQWNRMETIRNLEHNPDYLFGEFDDLETNVPIYRDMLSQTPLGFEDDYDSNYLRELEEGRELRMLSYREEITEEVNNMAGFTEDSDNEFTQEEIQEILSEGKNLAEEVNKRIAKEYADVEQAAKTAQKISAAYGGYANIMRTAWGTSGAITSLRSTFGVDAFFYENGWFFGVSPEGLDDLANFISKDFAGLCDTQKPTRDRSSGITTSNRAGSVTGLEQGLTIGARRTTQDTEDGVLYTYYIVGGAETDQEGLIYTVELDGNDLTDEIFGKSELTGSDVFGGENTALLQDVPERYTQICANLERTSDLNTYFETDIDNDRLCANIIQEGSQLR